MMVSKLAITIQKIFDGSLRILAQCSAMIIKANIMLEVIRDWIENKTENIFAPLHKITAYPHLENCPIQSTWQQYSGVPKSREEWLEIQNSYHQHAALHFGKENFRLKEIIKEVYTILSRISLTNEQKRQAILSEYENYKNPNAFNRNSKQIKLLLTQLASKLQN